MMRKSSFAAIAALLVSASAHAENLATYATACASKLGLTTIPGYSCTQGTTVTDGSQFFLQTSNNRVGRVATSNPNVDAVFLCRDYNSASNTAGLNGYILQNQITGNTCFFDAKEGTTGTVPQPTSANAGTSWEDPAGMNGACQTCHSGDPFIVSKGLSAGMKAQGMMRMGRNLKGAYHIVNSEVSTSFFYNWDAQRQITSNGCLASCHQTSSTTSNTNFFNSAVSGSWMPPQANTSFIPQSETPASIGVWRPGTQAYFYFDADGDRVWNSNYDQWGAFGTTGDKPFVLKGTDCAAGRVRAEFGTTRGSYWMLTKNNHYYDSGDDPNTFNFGAGAPTSWNGVAVDFETGAFVVDYTADNHYDLNSPNGGDLTFSFGISTDKPLVGRWKRGIGYRVATYRAVGTQGWWAFDFNGTNAWDAGDDSKQFGSANDIPFAGDFNGDGIDEIGTFSNGNWYVDMNNNFQWDGTAGGDAQWSFGMAGDIPVVSPTTWNCSW